MSNRDVRDNNSHLLKFHRITKKLVFHYVESDLYLKEHIR